MVDATAHPRARRGYREMLAGPDHAGGWACSVRVEPSDQPPFTATVQAWFKGAEQPPGLVAVRYDRADHRRVIVDDSAEARAAARQAEAVSG